MATSFQILTIIIIIIIKTKARETWVIWDCLEEMMSIIIKIWPVKCKKMRMPSLLMSFNKSILREAKLRQVDIKDTISMGIINNMDRICIVAMWLNMMRMSMGMRKKMRKMDLTLKNIRIIEADSSNNTNRMGSSRCHNHSNRLNPRKRRDSLPKSRVLFRALERKERSPRDLPKILVTMLKLMMVKKVMMVS